MRSKRLTPKTLLISGFLFLALLLVFSSQIESCRSFNLQKVKTYRDNFFALSNPEVVKRMRPVSTAKIEAELEEYIGQPFLSFSPEYWEKFWEIIYGIYPLEQQANPDLPNKMRQLSEGEIMGKLSSLYPRPFAHFKKEQWGSFFSLIMTP